MHLKKLLPLFFLLMQLFYFKCLFVDNKKRKFLEEFKFLNVFTHRKLLNDDIQSSEMLKKLTKINLLIIEYILKLNTS